VVCPLLITYVTTSVSWPLHAITRPMSASADGKELPATGAIAISQTICASRTRAQPAWKSSFRRTFVVTRS